MGTPVAAKDMGRFIVFKIVFQSHPVSSPLPGLLTLITVIP